MKKKYVTALEQREICNKTGNIWRIDDVPNVWREQVREQVEADGYIILPDGTVEKPVYTREDIDAMKSAELKEMAKRYGITGYSSMTVAELKAALMELI